MKSRESDANHLAYEDISKRLEAGEITSKEADEMILSRSNHAVATALANASEARFRARCRAVLKVVSKSFAIKAVVLVLFLLALWMYTHLAKV